MRYLCSTLQIKQHILPRSPGIWLSKPSCVSGRLCPEKKLTFSALPCLLIERRQSVPLRLTLLGQQHKAANERGLLVSDLHEINELSLKVMRIKNMREARLIY